MSGGGRRKKSSHFSSTSLRPTAAVRRNGIPSMSRRRRVRLSSPPRGIAQGAPPRLLTAAEGSRFEINLLKLPSNVIVECSSLVRRHRSHEQFLTIMTKPVNLNGPHSILNICRRSQAGEPSDEWTGWRLLTIAGLFDRWTAPSGGEPLYSYSVITVNASPSLHSIHDR